MRRFTALCLMLAALPVSAQIYQYTDDKGNRVFTDQPPTDVDARSIQLPSLNTVPHEPATDRYKDRNSPDAPSAAVSNNPYNQLYLTGLPEDQAIRANNGNFSVQVVITPNLAPQHRLQLLIDGQPYGTPSVSTTLQVINIDRGEHRIAVQVLAGDKVLQSSPEQTISVQRVHRYRPTP